MWIGLRRCKTSAIRGEEKREMDRIGDVWIEKDDCEMECALQVVIHVEVESIATAISISKSRFRGSS